MTTPSQPPQADNQVVPAEDAPSADVPVESPEADAAVGDAEPVAVEADPVVVETEPVAVETEPVVVESEPVAADAEPVPVEAEPVAVEADPVVVEAEPDAVESEPVAVEADPVVVETEPVVVETEPVVVESEPVVADAEPVPVEAEPVPVEADPVEAEADSVETAPAAADPEPVAVETEPAPPAAPAPRPRPAPRPLPPRPGSRASQVQSISTPAAPSPADELEAATWGRLDADGTVYVREGDQERAIGQYAGANPTEALALYVRRFLDLKAQVTLFETRLSILSQRDFDVTMTSLREAVTEPAAVGNLADLRQHLEGLSDKFAQVQAERETERAAAKAQALADRTVLVETVEKLAGADPAKVQWRQASDQLRDLLEQWREAQRSGPKIDKADGDALWKRLSQARNDFDRKRRQFFSELDQQQGEAKRAKEAIVAEAEKLASSKEWATTGQAFRDLMDRWRAAGRSGRKDDDALWARFRAAQDSFYGARSDHHSAINADEKANLTAKLEILTEAEKLVPVKDLAAAKAALRPLQDRWDAVGRVPRADLARIEDRMRAVETAIREADEAAWRRSNPETKARAQGAMSALEAAVAQLRAELAKAQAGGDARKIASLTEALAAREAWLSQVQETANDFS